MRENITDYLLNVIFITFNLMHKLRKYALMYSRDQNVIYL